LSLFKVCDDGHAHSAFSSTMDGHDDDFSPSDSDGNTTVRGLSVVALLCFEMGLAWGCVNMSAYVLLYALHGFGSDRTFYQITYDIQVHCAVLAMILLDMLLCRLRLDFIHYFFAICSAVLYVACYATDLPTGSPAAAVASIPASAGHVQNWHLLRRLWPSSSSLFSVLTVALTLFAMLLLFAFAVTITTVRDLCHPLARNPDPVVLPSDRTI